MAQMLGIEQLKILADETTSNVAALAIDAAEIKPSEEFREAVHGRVRALEAMPLSSPQEIITAHQKAIATLTEAVSRFHAVHKHADLLHDSLRDMVEPVRNLTAAVRDNCDDMARDIDSDKYRHIYQTIDSIQASYTSQQQNMAEHIEDQRIAARRLSGVEHIEEAINVIEDKARTENVALRLTVKPADASLPPAMTLSQSATPTSPSRGQAPSI